LRQLLEASDERTTLIAVHHPPEEEDDSLLDGDLLLRLIEPFPNVKAILSAHGHAYRIESRGDLYMVSLPALGMAFDEREPLGWIEACLSASRGVLKFHAVGENQTGDGAATTLRWR
jgi:hypothetical protein